MAPLRAFLVFGALASSVLGSKRMEAVRKMAAAKSLETAGLPDPMCSTGTISLKQAGKPQVCCAGYCGECTDYPTCKTVRGQNSTFACCATPVYDRRCGSAAANVCLKSCKESVPPCIMDERETFTTPDPSTRTAGEDCNEAVADWRQRAKTATKPASGSA